MALSKEAVEGRTLWESFPADMVQILEPHYRGALAGAHYPFDFGHAGRTYRAEIFPVTYANTEAGMVLIQDVTEERRAEDLAATNEQLERLSNAKSDFLSVVSHEFRTPLTGIQAFSELIRDEDFPIGRVKEFAGDINREAERLSRMIGDLLDLEHMESGQMVLRRETLDLNALIEEAVDTMRPNAPLHTLRVELDGSLPLSGDRDKLTQVVLNLLSNAVKYSPDGGAVVVGARIEGAQAHLWVRDEGIGIPDDALEPIFQRYTRLVSGPLTIRGTGLGLPIVRQIAEIHGGRAWAESRVGFGSTFHVTLPLASVVHSG